MEIEFVKERNEGVRVTAKFESNDGLQILKLGVALRSFPVVHFPHSDPYTCVALVHTMRSKESVEAQVKEHMERAFM